MATENLKEKTAKGLFWGSVSGLLQQALSLVIGICLARRLSPEEYFMPAVLMVFSLLAANVQDSGFPNALAVKRHAAWRDFNAVFWFSVLASVGCYALLFFLAPFIAAFNHAPELTLLSRVAFLGFVIGSLGVAHSAWLFRNLMVKERMKAIFLAVCLSGGVGITMVYMGFSYWGLVVQDLCYKAVVMLMYWKYSSFRPKWHINLRPIRRMVGFSSKILATNMLLTLNNQFLQAVLGHYYGRAEAGQYSQSNKWTTMGYTLVGGALAGVAQPVMAAARGEEERRERVLRKMMRFTAFVAFPLMLGMALIAPEFIPLALGEQWRACVPYLQILAVAGAFIPLNQLYGNFLLSGGKSGRFFLGTAGMLLMQLALIVGVKISGGDLQRLLLFVALMHMAWLPVWHLLARKGTHLRFIHILRDILPFALTALLCLAAGYGASRCVEGIFLKMMVKMGVTAVAYIALMWFSGAVVMRESVQFLLKRKL